MIQVLIISSLYSQTQHLRRILLGQAGHIQLCGTADNSVLGMSLIESLHPDVVIMPVHMTFWNPEDLINYLLPRGICPRFVLLSDGSEAVIEGAAAVKVQQLLPDAMPSDAMLLHAVEEAGRLQKHETGAVRPPENEYVQHSLGVMELLMGLVPVGTGSAQQQFGRLHVGSRRLTLSFPMAFFLGLILRNCSLFSLPLHNHLTCMPLFCILCKQAERFLFGAEQQTEGGLFLKGFLQLRFCRLFLCGANGLPRFV